MSSKTYLISGQRVNLDEVNVWSTQKAIQIMCMMRMLLIGGRVDAMSTRGRSADPTINPTIEKIAYSTTSG